jgi:ubiquinone/menaquinone biosynthesis C-methylase UbiE
MTLDNAYVTADYLKRVAETARTLKQRSYQLMQISRGDHVLDAGCGPAIDTLALAAVVGAQGKVYGLDNDPAMIAEAQRVTRTAGVTTQIEYIEATAMQIPLAANIVDAARAERLLQVLPITAEQSVVKELIRVTRPGGQIVLLDTDWGSASIDFSDSELEQRMMRFFAQQMRPNGYAGRRLYSLCRAHHLEEIELEVTPFIEHHINQTPFAQWLPDTATAEGIISSAEAKRWKNELNERTQQKSLYTCVNIVLVSGRKPNSL